MSAFFDKADEIKNRLEAVPALAGIDILVDRQKDIRSDFLKSIAKKKGAAIIIFFEGYTPHEGASVAKEAHPNSDVISDFVITVWSKPILKASSQASADDILQEIQKSLHGWQHNAVRCENKMHVSRARLVPNPSYLIYRIPTKIKHSLNPS